ncbi:hypothetical protein Tco_0697493 [Tanacetum coccineum]
MNETYYEPNPSYDSSGFDQPQPPQNFVDSHGILQALNKMQEELEEIKRDRRKKKEDMSIEEMRHEQQLVSDYKLKIFTNVWINPILEEFAGELAHIAPIPQGIVEADFDPNDGTSSDDDYFEDIEYVSLEEVNEVDQEEKEFDLEDIL